VFRVIACLAWFATVLLSTRPVAYAEETRLEVGTLVCRLAPSIGALIGSRRRMTCVFNSGTRTDRYSGTITRFGFDVGVTAGGLLSWRVLARTRPRPGALAGTYVGASADASVGVGAGAKALIGGSRRATMLQPIAWVANVGFNLAFGITGMTLRFTP